MAYRMGQRMVQSRTMVKNGTYDGPGSTRMVKRRTMAQYGTKDAWSRKGQDGPEKDHGIGWHK